MKDDFYKETMTKIIVSIVVFLVMVGGICAYMFWPESNEEISESEEIEYNSLEAEDDESEDLVLNIDDSSENTVTE